ncbi:hypothetical protein SAV31267_079670 [Streptomyces avermitilis]|uniref:Uncharacterized protein n=1 Tax=Streptomyces avermitilis TaxID=33903 RepID=A0A4D4N1V6_STRAX|nr:hypothetical protein SAV31267_079670 [Streptomyces avermitilis]
MGDTGTAEPDEMAYGRPGAAAVVAVDVHRGRGVARAVAPAGPPAEHGGHPGTADQARQRVVEVQREDERTVDMAAGEIAAHACVVVPPFREQQHELTVMGGQLLADAA